MSPLAARVTTALVLGLFVVMGTLYLDALVMSVFYGLVAFVGALEWAHLCGIRNRAAGVLYAAVTVTLGAVSFEACGSPGSLRWLFVAACLWWTLAALWVVGYQARRAGALHNPLALGAIGWVVFTPAMCAVMLLLQRHPPALLALFATVWSADILAYFGGRALGRVRLASRVSPGKTWEGLLVALVGTAGLGAATAAVVKPAAIGYIVVLVVVTLLASVIGDLFESLLKRMRGCKDSGTILPGHGGMLDRIDSMLAAAPVFSLGILALAHK